MGEHSKPTVDALFLFFFPISRNPLAQTLCGFPAAPPELPSEACPEFLNFVSFIPNAAGARESFYVVENFTWVANERYYDLRLKYVGKERKNKNKTNKQKNNIRREDWDGKQQGNKHNDVNTRANSHRDKKRTPVFTTHPHLPHYDSSRSTQACRPLSDVLIVVSAPPTPGERVRTVKKRLAKAQPQQETEQLIVLVCTMEIPYGVRSLFCV